MDPLLGALAFGCLIYLATLWCERVVRRDPHEDVLVAHALRAALCCAAACAGATLLAHSAPPATIFAVAILCAALGATCFLATLGSPVPVAVPGIALAILAGASLLQGNPGPLVSAVATGAPFAIAAFFVRGKSGSDWRDGVVAALGGAAFGLQLGLVACTFAGVAIALARPYLARRRTQPQPRVSFSPALAGTFLIVLVSQLAIS